MPSLDLSSCHSPSASPTPPGSGAIRGVKSMSVPSYPRSQGSVSSPRAPPVTSPRQPPSFGRSHSFKSPLPRGEKTNLQTKVLTLAICVSVAGVRRSSHAAQSDGSSQSSSASLVREAPPLAPFSLHWPNHYHQEGKGGMQEQRMREKHFSHLMKVNVKMMNFFSQFC